MMVVRLAGAALMAVACGGGGVALSLAKRREWQKIYAFAALLEYFRAAIQFQAMPCTVLLEQAAGEPRFADLDLEACRTFSDIDPPSALGTALRAQAQQVLAELATAPRQRACALLSRLAVQCRTAEDAAAQTAAETARLYPKLGLCLGILAVLVLF